MKPRQRERVAPCRRGGTATKPCNYSMCEPCGDLRDDLLRKEIVAWRGKIEARCGPKDGDGWIVLDTDAPNDRHKERSVPVPEGARRGKVAIPKAPFLHWALHGSSGEHLAPPWEPVAWSGLKMANDDRNHTDVLVGAGFSIDDPEWRDGWSEATPFSQALYAARFEWQEKLLEFEVGVLLAGDFVSGIVVHPEPGEGVRRIGHVPSHVMNKVQQYDVLDKPVPVVVVLPANCIDYTPALLTADAVILEGGGSAAHAVKVAGERRGAKVPVVRDPDARRKYPPGAHVWVDTKRGRVEVSSVLDHRTRRLYWDPSQLREAMKVDTKAGPKKRGKAR